MWPQRSFLIKSMRNWNFQEKIIFPIEFDEQNLFFITHTVNLIDVCYSEPKSTLHAKNRTLKKKRTFLFFLKRDLFDQKKSMRSALCRQNSHRFSNQRNRSARMTNQTAKDQKTAMFTNLEAWKNSRNARIKSRPSSLNIALLRSRWAPHLICIGVMVSCSVCRWRLSTRLWSTKTSRLLLQKPNNRCKEVWSHTIWGGPLDHKIVYWPGSSRLARCCREKSAEPLFCWRNPSIAAMLR